MVVIDPCSLAVNPVRLGSARLHPSSILNSLSLFFPSLSHTSKHNYPSLSIPASLSSRLCFSSALLPLRLVKPLFVSFFCHPSAAVADQPSACRTVLLGFTHALRGLNDRRSVGYICAILKHLVGFGLGSSSLFSSVFRATLRSVTIRLVISRLSALQRLA